MQYDMSAVVIYMQPACSQLIMGCLALCVYSHLSGVELIVSTLEGDCWASNASSVNLCAGVLSELSNCRQHLLVNYHYRLVS